MTALNDFYTVTIDTNNETFTINKQYKIIRKVGAGSYGSVCSALNVNTNEGKEKRALLLLDYFGPHNFIKYSGCN